MRPRNAGHAFGRAGAERSFTDRELLWLVAPLASLALLLTLLPLARLAAEALTRGGAIDPAATLRALAQPSVLRAAAATIEIGLLSSSLALALGTGFALVLRLTDVASKRTLAFVFVWSLMVAPQVAALAFKTLLGPASPLLGAVGMAPPPGSVNPLVSKLGIILVLGLHHAPLAAITLAPSLARIPNALIEAASLDGATPWTIVRAIILPLIRPALAAAALLVFVAGIGNFGIPALLGIPAGVLTLPTLIYRQLSSFGPSVIADVASLSMATAVLAGPAALAASIALRRGASDLSTEAPLRPFIALGRWRRAVAAAAWICLALAVLLPFLSLIATSLVPAYGVRLGLATLTFEAYAEILGRQQLTYRALRNSFVLAGSAAILLALLAALLAYGLERRPRRWSAAFETLLELPYVLPGVVLAIACILLFLKPLPVIGLSIYATPAIILFAYLARFLTVAMKPVRSALALVSRDCEEAAAVDGAGLWRRLRMIVAPALLPSLAAGALLVFLLAFNELTVSALLWSAGTETLGVALMSLEDAGLATEAAALATLTAAFVALLMLLLDRMAARLPDGVLPWQSLVR